MRRLLRLLLPVLLLSGLVSCDKSRTRPEPEELSSNYYSNLFVHAYMDAKYLWNKQIADALDNWDYEADPAEQVEKARYQDDLWTQFIPDFATLTDQFSGNSQGTYGLGVVFHRFDSTPEQICAMVTHTFAGSPARAAGLQRGDIIVNVDGEKITMDNVYEILDKLSGVGGSVQLSLLDGRSLSLSAVAMYENPVLFSKVFDFDGVRVGYLVYTSFTLDSYADLIDVCKSFRAQGVRDVILDLRYNTGGYVMAELFLGSMLAPESAVEAGEVILMEVYNDDTMKRFASQGISTEIRFQQDFDFESRGKKYTFSTRGANVGCERVIAIVERWTASASEALIGDLNAYMPVVVVGRQTHGKYCTGVTADAERFYTDNESTLGVSEAALAKEQTANVGLYMMIARYANKNGVTLSMPDGIKPEALVDDKPWDGYQLGDPSETMLNKALVYCGYLPAPAPAALRARPAGSPLGPVVEVPQHEGYRILTELPHK